MSSTLKYIFLGVLCICLILCSTCVFAIDNTTSSENIDLSDVTDPSNMAVTTDEPVEKYTMDNNPIEQLNNDNNTVLQYTSKGSNLDYSTVISKTSHPSNNIIFAGEEINTETIIYDTFFNSSSLNGYTNGIINHTKYSATYNKLNHEFTLDLSKEVNGLVYSKTFQVNNVTNSRELFYKLENQQYNPIMILTVNAEINNTQDYIKIITSHVNIFLEPFKNSTSDKEIDDEINRCKQKNINYSFKTHLNVNFKKTLNFECSNTWDFFYNYFDIININGKESRIYSKFDKSEEYTFSKLTAGKMLVLSNLIIAGFNKVIENTKGVCICNGILFDHNKMDYTFDEDYGAGIYNDGSCICNNCRFTNNYAKYGGAIYNKGSLVLQNCSFANNTGYGSGNDVANIGSGIVMIDGKMINGSDGPVKHLDENLNFNLIIIGVIAAGISLIPGVVGVAIADVVFLCSWGGSFAIGAGVGAVAGAGIGTGASFIASSITGVEVKSLLGKYIPICIISGIAGALIGAYAFASIGGTNNNNIKKDHWYNYRKAIFDDYTPETQDEWLEKYYHLTPKELSEDYTCTIQQIVDQKLIPSEVAKCYKYHEIENY